MQSSKGSRCLRRGGRGDAVIGYRFSKARLEVDVDGLRGHIISGYVIEKAIEIDDARGAKG